MQHLVEQLDVNVKLCCLQQKPEANHQQLILAALIPN
jgi:hypothetical protein